MEDRRKNDELILYKLEEIQTDIKDMQTAIHGNGAPGIKTRLSVIQTKVHIVSGVLVAAVLAIFNDYIRRG